jgi:hypothetical protein
MYILVGTRDSRTQSARACKPALLHLAFRTWVSGSQYLVLRTWVSGPLHLTVVFYFSRHFSLRLVVTDRRTDARNK